MARSEPTLEETKQQLIASLNESRREMVIEIDEVSGILNLPGQIKESFLGDQWKWLGGALAAGIAVGFLASPGKKGKRSKNVLHQAVKAPVSSTKRSLILALAGTLARSGFDLAKPTLSKMAQDAVQKWAKGPPNNQ